MTERCPNCVAGQLKSTTSAYVTLWHGQLFIDPRLPTWRCDVCGYAFHDPAALARLNLLTSPEQPNWDQKRLLQTLDDFTRRRGPSRWSS